MKNIFLFVIVFVVYSLLVVAQSQPPQVSNVLFCQRTDGTFIVDVNYDVNDPEGSAMTVTMHVSSDNGSTWDFPCTLITGDIGSSITSGTDKHIIWNFGIEHPQTFSDQFKIKIIADDEAFNTGIPCPGEPTVLYEGITYHTVLIGTQCWLRENLNVGARIDGSQEQTNNADMEKYCYDDNEDNCTTYGGLYQWAETVQYLNGATNTNDPNPEFIGNVQGICPLGWHIPTDNELNTLGANVNYHASALLEEGQGVGTNESGFSALLGGSIYCSPCNFYDLGLRTSFWTSTNQTGPFAQSAYIYGIWIYHYVYYPKINGFSVRCLKD